MLLRGSPPLSQHRRLPCLGCGPSKTSFPQPQRERHTERSELIQRYLSRPTEWGDKGCKCLEVGNALFMFTDSTHGASQELSGPWWHLQELECNPCLRSQWGQDRKKQDLSHYLPCSCYEVQSYRNLRSLKRLPLRVETGEGRCNTSRTYLDIVVYSTRNNLITCIIEGHS